MERNDPRYQAYVEILKEELIPAMGCTEPIALAYAAAKAREVLGVLPDSVQLQVSGSIIKNVKSVIVPNTAVAAETRPPRFKKNRSSTVNQWQSFKTFSPSHLYSESMSVPARFSMAAWYTSCLLYTSDAADEL